MNHDIPWADLRQQIQKNRVNFLTMEVELVGTLCGRALSTIPIPNIVQKSSARSNKLSTRYDTLPIGSMTTAPVKPSSTAWMIWSVEWTVDANGARFLRYA